MSPTRRFPVLIATDGSPDARAAVGAAVAFPWPRGARATGVVAQAVWPAGLSRGSGGAMEAAIEQMADQARRVLAARWPRARVSIVSGPVAPAILAEARRCRARTIVLGRRGHGGFSRLLLGSVSRSVVAGAPCSVLVARSTPRKIARVVVGVDGSARARRAVDLVARLAPGRGSRVSVVRVLEPIRIPSLGLLPARTRTALGAEAAALHARRLRAAEQEVSAAVQRLARAGWRARGVVRIGLPIPQLLQAVGEARADLLVIGARGVGGVDRLLLGSVADAAIQQAPVSVLVAR